MLIWWENMYNIIQSIIEKKLLVCQDWKRTFLIWWSISLKNQQQTCHDEMLKAFPVSLGTVKDLIFLYSGRATSGRNVYFQAVGHFPFTEDPRINGQYWKVGLPTGVSYEKIHCLLKERVWPKKAMT